MRLRKSSMLRRSAVLLVVALACPLASPFSGFAAAQGEKKAEGGAAAVSRAREILDLFLKGRYDDFLAAGSDPMKAALKKEQLSQIAALFEAQLGAYRSEVSAEDQKTGEFDAVTFTLRYERGTLKLLVTV